MSLVHTFILTFIVLFIPIGLWSDHCARRLKQEKRRAKQEKQQARVKLAETVPEATPRSRTSSLAERLA
jgi:hypothetical protein